MSRKVAVVTFNLGGPDKPDAVQPFLFNLFNDPAIIGVPNPFRWLLARFIARRRAPIAREIYDHLGGSSPLLKFTEDQCRALGMALTGRDGGTEYKTFIAMRYWHPMSLEAAERVRDFDPDVIVLLPLYPQYSTTTSGSSLREWHRAARTVDLEKPTRAVCCYPENGGWIGAQTDLLGKALEDWRRENPDLGPPRVLFSAHGLPKKVIAGGDPYQWQVEQTTRAVLGKLTANGYEGVEGQVCYQSRVGPLEWIGPSTEDEIKRAGEQGRGLIVVPIAFVSEHSETLVELDIEYGELAEKSGVPRYVRVPAVADHAKYIEGMADAVMRALERGDTINCDTGKRICPAEHGRCPLAPNR